MPSGAVHLSSALLLGGAVLVWRGVPPLEGGSILLGMAIGSLLPDVDHAASPLLRPLVFRPVGWLLRRCGLRHRGPTHALPVALVVCLVLGLLWPGWALALLAGWTLHILEDACTPTGVPLWWPVVRPRRRHRVGVRARATAGRTGSR